MLSILMIGAGGIGGYYGARLSEAGHRVVLTARGSHLAALRKRGSWFTMKTGGWSAGYRP